MGTNINGLALVLVKYNSFRLYSDIKSKWEVAKRIIISWTSKKNFRWSWQWTKDPKKIQETDSQK